MSGAEIRVELGPRAYDIVVGAGTIAEAGARTAKLSRGNRLFVIADEVVAKLHLAALTESLEAAGIDHREIILPPGEQTKDFAHLQRLAEDLLDAGADRGAMLVAFGGGVVGDLAGFAASLLLRGVDFIQIPTTLLAQVDSSVGGKTGINTRHGKNLVGSFHQPRLVLIDTDLLATLPRREILAGYAEIVKYGLIGDAEFFAWLETNGAAVCGRDADALAHAIAASCAAKAAVVAADEHESGRRALLNLGHTFGHALEAETGYGAEIRHGEAVAAGMAMAFDLSARMGLCPAADAARLRDHLRLMGLPAGLRDLPARRWEAARLLAHMAQDKKMRDGKMNFVLARRIGDAFLARDVDTELVRLLLTEAGAA